MFGFGKKDDNTQTNPQNTNPANQNGGNGNIGVQVNGSNPAPFDPNYNLTTINDPFANPQFAPAPQQMQMQQPMQNFAEPQNQNMPPQMTPQPMPLPQAPMAPEPPMQVNIPNPTSINPGPATTSDQLQAQNQQASNNPSTPDEIINCLKNNQTFKLENYEFGFDSSKVNDGNAFWEKGPTGTVYGDEAGLREFLSEQSMDTLNEIGAQMSMEQQAPQSMQEPTPQQPEAPVQNEPEMAPEVPIIPATTISNSVDTDPVFDKAKLSNFVEFYEGLEEAYKLAKTYIESAE